MNNENYDWFDYMEELQGIKCSCCRDSKKIVNPKKQEVADKYYDMVDRFTENGEDYTSAELLAGMKYPHRDIPEYITCPECSTGEEIIEEKEDDSEPAFVLEPSLKTRPSDDDDEDFTWYDYIEAVKK